MNSRPRLSKSGIEYLDYSWGVWSGCRNLETGNCSVKACWAKGITNRYPKLYPDGFNPHYYPEAIDSPMRLKRPSRISVGWVGDVIGYCDSRSIAREKIEKTIKDCPQHTFLFLTKNPEKLHTWNPFPDNCWVGVTATNQEMFIDATIELSKIAANIKYISFEPLLERINGGECEGNRLDVLKDTGINWVIIGAQTKPTVLPKIEWITEIIEACDKAGVKVFLKQNIIPALHGLKPFYKPLSPSGYGSWELRQEMPHIEEIKTREE